MGAWGTAIFSDDTASDVRQEFRDLVGEGRTPEEATKLMVENWRDTVADAEEGGVFWLALASTQWSLGRLLPDVKSKALRVIDSGSDLKRWETAGSKGISKRLALLSKLREQLVSPQPAQKKVPPPFRNSTSWAVGDVVAYRLLTLDYCLLRVIGHHTDRGGTSPVVELLDWTGATIPEASELRRIPICRRIYPSGEACTQFMVGATSNRGFPVDRLFETGISLKPTQKPKNYSVFLWRFLDKQLFDLFGLGRAPAPR